jgi:oxygen-independent coproporphyrinogen III oxidase
VHAAVRFLYIHWPFCPYKCHFCPFVALAGHDSFMASYHQALVQEIEQFALGYQEKTPIKTIFFGGGTPSTYPDDLLLDMFDTLKRIFTFEDDIEITLEVNPGTVRLPDQLLLWKRLGINRLSIGVQSLKDDVLKELNRHQQAQDVFTLINAATDLFENISIDLILGLPGVSAVEWKELLERVVQWPIQHLSLYFLTVHEDTPLYFKVKRKQVTVAPDNEMVDLYHWSCELLARSGFIQYEMSNFARAGFACEHNQAYWDRVPFKGFGLGACSFDGEKRFENDKRLLTYLEQAGQGHVVSCQEQLTDKQVVLERLMLGLRRRQGIRWEQILPLLSAQESEKFCQQVALLKQEQLIQEREGHLILTPHGLVVENEIVVRLL